MIINLLYGQENYRFVLKNDDVLWYKAGDENYNIIISELDKMVADYNSKIDIDNYWKEKYSEKVYTGTSFDEDGYLTALLSLNNPSQADADYLKSSFTKRTYKNVEKERNREISPNVISKYDLAEINLDIAKNTFNSYWSWIIHDSPRPLKPYRRGETGYNYSDDITIEEIQDIIKIFSVRISNKEYLLDVKINDTKEKIIKLKKIVALNKKRNDLSKRYLGTTVLRIKAEWSDVVSYYGGYSELSKLGISKDDKSKFDVAVVFEKIELIGPSTCLAHVKINGNDDALKFHKIPKSTYKYEGEYNIDYDKDYLTLYDGGFWWLNLKFDKNNYLPEFKERIFLDESLLPSISNYRNTIELMLDNLLINDK